MKKLFKYTGWIFVVLCLFAAFHRPAQTTQTNAPLDSSPTNASSAVKNVSNSTTNTATKKPSHPVFVTVGKPGNVGNIQVTVNNLQIVKTVGSDGVTSTANGYYWVINVTVKNNDNVPRLVDSSLFQIQQDTGAKFDSDPTADMYLNSSNDFFIQNLNPGVSMTGFIAFDMPTAPTFNSVKEHFLLVSGGLPLTLQQTSFELP